MQASRLLPVICLVTSSALWGAVTVLNKALLAFVPAIPLLAIQLAASGAALLAFVGLRRLPMPTLRAAVPLALLGVLNPGLSYSLALLGLVTVTASTAALLWAAEPLLIVALAAIILREPVTPRLVAIILAGLIGVTLVTGALSGASIGRAELVGTALIMLAILLCALYTVLSRRLIASADPVVTAMVQQAAGLAWCLLAMAFGPFGGPPEVAALPWNTLAYAVLSGLLYYALAYGLFLTALRVTPAGIASGYYNLIPVFGVTLAYVFLGERLTGPQMAGAALILVSALFLVRLTAGAESGPSRLTGR